MKYRKFGKLDWEVSVLGFGAMRLPTIDGDSGQIDTDEAIRMVRYAIDHGVNYLDSAYFYHRGNSEAFLAQALQDGYRERVRVATKLPSGRVKTADDMDRLLDEQRERLQIETLDFYLLHGLNSTHWANYMDLNVLDWAERAMAQNKFRHFGFSFHDEYAVFQEIIDSYDNWTLCQIQYNYMDEEHQAGTRGLNYAAEKGLAVVVMEPIRGGLLSRTPPQPIADLWGEIGGDRSPAEWALQWVWNHPQVTLALSGMSTMDHVVENVVSASRSGPNSLSEAELEQVSRVRDTYRRLAPIPCTACEYCLPCPGGVSIPTILRFYNEAIMYDHVDRSRRMYGWFVKPEERGDRCTECGECLPKCPQNIAIPEWLAKAHEMMGEVE